ncbi:hypothetical protein TNCT_606601 [Trichonephila clavata]|uniref:Uncharacterized protein n=1 Tax=Trichonephila clavata TaxID=2740835 RepID=A0A8X6IR21_TRICU|nr:hypothetical protein TNCT_606601 [Trichonephila clavata]
MKFEMIMLFVMKCDTIAVKIFMGKNPKQSYSSERLSRYEAEQKLKAIQIKQEQVQKRRMEIIHKRDEVLKRSAEEFKEKLKQVKMNQQELDKAMESWQQQVVCYQKVANLRATEKVAEILSKDA